MKQEKRECVCGVTVNATSVKCCVFCSEEGHSFNSIEPYTTQLIIVAIMVDFSPPVNCVLKLVNLSVSQRHGHRIA